MSGKGEADQIVRCTLEMRFFGKEEQVGSFVEDLARQLRLFAGDSLHITQYEVVDAQSGGADSAAREFAARATNPHPQPRLDASPNYTSWAAIRAARPDTPERSAEYEAAKAEFEINERYDRA